MQENSEYSPQEDYLQRFEPSGVRFDVENMLLLGSYEDELSVHRAKKVWHEILTGLFYLDRNVDFSLKARCMPIESIFMLECEFVSSAGRYALWRLINNQAPEAQYIIETAHVPEGSFDQKIKAPDLCSLGEPALFSKSLADEARARNSAEYTKSVKEMVISWLTTLTAGRR